METERREYLFSNRDLRKLVIPLLVEQFLSIFVGLVDSIMVASVGEAAVSAVSLIDTVMILLINVFFALAMGGAIIAGQALGRKNREEGCEAYEQSLLLSVVFSIFVMIVVYAGKWFILNVLFGKIEPDVMRNCDIYLCITTLSVPFIALYNVGAAMHRAMGDSKTPMKMSIVMNLLNMCGNALLIYGLKWGIEGAAVPTTLSRAFAGIWMVTLMKDSSKALHIRTFAIRVKRNILRKILHIAIPYTLENSMFQLGKIVLLSMISGFGTASIAANAVANMVSAFAVVGGAAASHAMSAVTAQCVGAGDYYQVRYYTRKLLKFSYLGLLVINVLIIALLPVIIHVYGLSPDTAQMARWIIVFHSVSAMLIWAPSFNLPNVLRAANDVKFCMWVSIGSMWFFRIGLCFILSLRFDFGVYGVWISMITDWFVRSIIFVARYRGKRWEMKH